MKNWRDMKAADLARFIVLAKQGHPYEGPMVIEDVPGKTPPPIAAALQYQQRDHMERGVEYARKVLGLGVRRIGQAPPIRRLPIWMLDRFGCFLTAFTIATCVSARAARLP